MVVVLVDVLDWVVEVFVVDVVWEVVVLVVVDVYALAKL